MKKVDRVINDYERLTRVELARCFGVDPRTVSRWRAMGLPQRDGGRYCLPDCIAWRLEKEALCEAESGATKSQPESEKQQKYLELYRKERWRLARIERLKLQGKLAPIEVFERNEVARTLDLKNSLLSFARGAAPRLEGKSVLELKEALLEQVWLLLGSFYKNSAFKYVHETDPKGQNLIFSGDPDYEEQAEKYLEQGRNRSVKQ